MTPRAPVTHLLKVWPMFIPALADGSKTFEARKNDRDFRIVFITRAKTAHQLPKRLRHLFYEH